MVALMVVDSVGKRAGHWDIVTAGLLVVSLAVYSVVMMVVDSVVWLVE